MASDSKSQSRHSPGTCPEELGYATSGRPADPGRSPRGSHTGSQKGGNHQPLLSLRFWWPPRSPAESRLGGLRGPLRAAEPEAGRRGWVRTCFPLWAPCSGATALPGGLPCSQPTPGTSLPGPPSHSPSVSGPCISYTAPQSTGCERRAVSRSRLPPAGPVPAIQPPWGRHPGGPGDPLSGQAQADTGGT